MNYVSLGGNCAVAYQLDIRKLSNARYPFDWCNMTIHQLIDTLDNNFNNFEDINIVKKSEKHVCFKTNDNYSLILKNKYNIKFAHELLKDSDIENFKKKIRRRIERFNLLKEPVFIRLELQNKDKKYLSMMYNSLYKKLLKKFTKCKLIIIVNKHLETYDNIFQINFDNFDSNWKYNSIDWDNIFN